MSEQGERLVWKTRGNPPHYSVHADPDYSVCKVGSARGWTFECWIGREQRRVGLLYASEAKAWCQRHYNRRRAKENGNAANAESA